MRIQNTRYKLRDNGNSYTLFKIQTINDKGDTKESVEITAPLDGVVRYLKSAHPKAVGVDNIVQSGVEDANNTK